MTEIKEQLEIKGAGKVSFLLNMPEILAERFPSGVILAHARANNMTSSLLEYLAKGFAGAGYPTMRFNFPYSENNKKSPDSEKVLKETWLSAYKYFSENAGFALERVVAAGKSMGARLAAQLAGAGEFEPDRMIFYGYPLHAPGKKDNIRASHLYEIKSPMLFFAGSRDSLCDTEKITGVVKGLAAPSRLEIIKGGDHSFRLKKSSEKSQEEVYADILEKSLKWLSGDIQPEHSG